MITIFRRLSVGLMVAGAAVGLAGPASAEPPDGSYDLVVTGGPFLRPGTSFPVTMTPGGPDCTRMVTVTGATTELRLQGNNWIGTSSVGQSAYTFDQQSLAGSEDSEGIVHTFQLTKNG